MPKCNDCGNTESFDIREVTFSTAYYDPSGIVWDTKYHQTDSVTGVRCTECESIEVEGPF
jgi:hypothetical protein